MEIPQPPSQNLEVATPRCSRIDAYGSLGNISLFPIFLAWIRIKNKLVKKTEKSALDILCRLL